MSGGIWFVPGTFDGGRGVSGPIHAFARVVAKRGRDGEIRAALLALVAPARAEPGNFYYEVHQSIDQPAILIVHDGWESPAALDAHNATDAVAAMRAIVDPLCAEPLTWSLTRLVSAPAAPDHPPMKEHD